MSEPNKTKTAPFEGVRVINLSGAWAGRIAAMLLADQGADAIDIQRPDRNRHPADPLIDRGKRVVRLNFSRDEEKQKAIELAKSADIVIDNMRPGAAKRFGLDYESLKLANEALVHVALPGFAKGDVRHQAYAWEGAVNAAVGVFTDVAPLGPLLGGEPIYTAIPMASAYGGVHGALAAALGLFHRMRSGQGQHIEVPLADAVLSAMALLAAKIEGQPARYNLPSIDNPMMNVAFPIFRDLADHLTAKHRALIAGYLKSYQLPTFNDFECADGRRIFLNATDHVHQSRAALEVLGIFDDLVAEGLVIGNPYAETDGGNNLNNTRSLSPAWQKRLIEAVAERFKTRPAHEWETALRDANVPNTLIQTTAEWLAREELRAGAVVSTLGDPEYGETIQAGRFLSLDGPDMASPSLSSRSSVGGDVDWRADGLSIQTGDKTNTYKGMLDGVRVLDLSNVIAGPAAGRTLAEFGADVIRIDPPAPQAGPRMTNWFGVDVNQGKRAMILDLKSERGQEIMTRLVANADVVLHNFLDRSAKTLGIGHNQLTAIKPDIISCQISAWGGPDGGPFKDDPAFDPVLQAASGIMARYGTSQQPVLHAIASCVDYITGFAATLGIVQALAARSAGRGGAYVRTALAMGAQLVQFPFVIDHMAVEHGREPSGQDARGDGAHQHLYRADDGWVFVGCRRLDLAAVSDALGATAQNAQAIAEKAGKHSMKQLMLLLDRVPGAVAMPVASLQSIRESHTVDADETMQVAATNGSLQLVRSPHPSGYPTTLPVPTWHRPDSTVVRRLFPAPWPGAHTRDILRETGWTFAEIDQILADGAAATEWPMLKHYLPK